MLEKLQWITRSAPLPLLSNFRVPSNVALFISSLRVHHVLAVLTLQESMPFFCSTDELVGGKEPILLLYFPVTHREISNIAMAYFSFTFLHLVQFR